MIVCLMQTGPAVMERGKRRKEPCRFLPCISTEMRHQRREPKSMIWKKYEKVTVLPPPHAELEGWPDIHLPCACQIEITRLAGLKGQHSGQSCLFPWLCVLICHAHLSSAFSMFFLIKYSLFETCLYHGSLRAWKINQEGWAKTLPHEDTQVCLRPSISFVSLVVLLFDNSAALSGYISQSICCAYSAGCTQGASP